MPLAAGSSLTINGCRSAVQDDWWSADMLREANTPSVADEQATTTTHTCAVMDSMWPRKSGATSTLHAVEKAATTDTLRSAALGTKWSEGTPLEEITQNVVTRPVIIIRPTCAVMGNTSLRKLEMTSTLHVVERPATTSTRKSAVQETTLSEDISQEGSTPSAVTKPVTTTTLTCAVMDSM